MAHPILKSAWYQVPRTFAGLAVAGYLRCRWYDSWRLPASGPVVLVANHQSHLDPVLIAVGCRRRLCFLARKTLFVGPLGGLIASVDAIPIDQTGGAASGLKETLRRLKHGRAVLVFPEGTRTRDGAIGRLHAGFCTLARRTSASILPVGIDGAYDAWPRTRRWPRSRPVVVQFGTALCPGVVRTTADADLIEMITLRLAECHDRAALRLAGRPATRSG